MTQSERGMFITLIDPLNNPVQLEKSIYGGNRAISLFKIQYSVSWYNIASDMLNNIMTIHDTELNTHTYIPIPDGYYNLTTLQATIQSYIPSFNATLNIATGKINLQFNQSNTTLKFQFGSIMGFDPNVTFSSGLGYMASSLPTFNPNPFIFVYLDQLNANKNILDGRYSYLLCSFADDGLQFGSIVEKTFNPLQYVRLATTQINELTISLRDRNGAKLNFRNINCIVTLKIEDD